MRLRAARRNAIIYALTLWIRAVTRRRCGLFFRRKKRDAAEPRTKRGLEPDADGTLLVDGDWTRHIWRRQPVRVPATLDVAEFLDRSPVPSIWPDDAEFNEYFGGDDEAMRRCWVLVLLNHPEDDVVAQCLRSPHLESVSLHTVPVADLLVGPRVAEEAAAAVWRMDDYGVHQVFNVLLSRGLEPSDHTQAQTDRAIALLRAACPEDRLALFQEEAGDEDEHERTAHRLVELTSAAERAYGALGAEDRERWHTVRYVDGLVGRGTPPEGFAERVEIRAIGHRLNSEGGFALMRSVAVRAGQLSDRRMAERRLNHHWDEIGEWMA